MRTFFFALAACFLLATPASAQTAMQLLNCTVPNNQLYINFLAGFDPAKYEGYRLQFDNVTRNDWEDPQGFPGQETLFVMPQGAPWFDGSPTYTSAAIWEGNPPPTLAPIAQLSGGMGMLFTVDTLGPPNMGMTGYVEIMSPGVVNGVAMNTTYHSDIVRFDTGGNVHHSLYGGSYAGAPGKPIVGIQLIYGDQWGERLTGGRICLWGIPYE